MRLVSLFIILLMFAYVFPAITSVEFVDSFDNPIDFDFDRNAQGYGDGFGGASDGALKVCADTLPEVQNMYALVVYHVGGASNDFINIGSEPLHNYTQLTNCSGTCCKSPYYFDINPTYAHLPGKPYVILSADTTFDNSDTFLLANFTLTGGYTSGMPSLYPSCNFRGYCDYKPITSFDPFGVVFDECDNYHLFLSSDGGSLVCYPDIYERDYDSSTGTLSEYLDTFNNNNGQIIYDDYDFYAGACNATPSAEYWSCWDSVRVNLFPSYTLNYGLTPANDGEKFYAYNVINGIGCRFCIGPDPAIQSISSSNSRTYPSTLASFGGGDYMDPPASSIDWGQMLYMTNPQDHDLVLYINLSNRGNYDFTNNIQLNISVNNSGGTTIYTDQQIYSGGLASYSVTQVNITIPSTVFSSTGLYNITVTIDPLTVANCYNYDDSGPYNYITVNITDPVTPQLTLYINGQNTSTLNDSCRPYNISVYVNDSSGNPIPGVGVRLVQVNGISLFAPVQKLDAPSLTGLSSRQYAETSTLANGYANFTVVPTGNEFYTTYSYLDMDDYVGNYSLYLELYNLTTNETIEFNNGSAIVDRQYLELVNLTCITPDVADEHTYYHPFHSEFKQIVQLMYNTFASIYRWLGE